MRARTTDDLYLYLSCSLRPMELSQTLLAGTGWREILLLELELADEETKDPRRPMVGTEAEGKCLRCR